MRTTKLALALSLAAACSGSVYSADVSPDGGSVDVSTPDAGAPFDAGSLDAGSPAGPPDAGLPAPDAGAADAGPVGVNAPSLGGCQMFPADNDFNRDVTGDSV